MPPHAAFAPRYLEVRAQHGPLVLGLDPSDDVLRQWGLEPEADDLERFVDLALEAAAGAVGLVKPQSAFYERHGWRGVRALSRLMADAASAGILVILDAKRGDIGSTNAGYAAAYLAPGAPMPADALTVVPYLGVGAMGPLLDAAVVAGAGLFVVTRSSNPEGRELQESRGSDGLTVEQRIVAELGTRNRTLGDDVGPFGAVFAPTHEPPRDIDLAGMQGLFLAPGVGAQGATLDDVAACFAACPQRVLPSISRALLQAGPDRHQLRDAILEAAGRARVALGG